MHNTFLKIAPSNINGQGLFSTIKISNNAPIIEITGKLYNSDNIPNNQTVIQIGNNLYIGASGGMDDYINHSCNPNCYLHIVGKRAFLYSIYEIKKNSEITFDYSTTSTDSLDDWEMLCTCQSIKCRKIISGWQYLNKELINIYNKNNILPFFMKKIINER